MRIRESFAKYISCAILLIVAGPAYPESCRFGLGYDGNGSPSCSAREEIALARVSAAQSICLSANSRVQWSKNNKEPTWAWSAIRAGEAVAVKGFVAQQCERADLVVKYDYDDMTSSVTMNVTDAESGETVFQEMRTVADLHSDAVRMASHWHEMVVEAREEARAASLAAERAASEAKAVAEREARQRDEQLKKDEAARRCETEFNALKQNIIAYVDIQRAPIPEDIQNRITAHNAGCPNAISPEIVAQEQKAEADAKRAVEAYKRGQEQREQQKARLEKAKQDALTAWKAKVGSAPFVPPVDGWAKVSTAPNVLYYIILPGIGGTDTCHFALDGNRSALDCLGSTGRNDYVSVQENERWYLLKSKSIPGGEYAASVKEKGLTMCLRKAGCFRILAEVRPEPVALPERFPVIAPGPSTSTFVHAG